jgi:hypothetical protein
MKKALITLRNRISLLKKDVEEAHVTGKLPADYSLGMINGLIFCEQIFSDRHGQPKFFNRTGSIGDLPKPVMLISGNAIKDTITYQLFIDEIILKTRNLIWPTAQDRETGVVAFTKKIDELKKTFKSLDDFIAGETAITEENKNGHGNGDESRADGELQHTEPSNVREMRPRTDSEVSHRD